MTAGQSFILGYTNEEYGIYKASNDNPVIIFDDFTTSFHWVDFDFKVKSSAMKMLRTKDSQICLFKYVFYAMQTLKYVPYGHTRQWIENYSRLQIPLPPLAVQREIVRVLDNFTLLSAELTAELTARRKQYEFYRDKLLTFDTSVQYISLSDLAQFTYGFTDTAKDEGDARFVRITDIDENGCLNPYNAKYITLSNESKKYLLKKGDLLLARTGATYGKTLYVPNDDPAVYASFLIKITLDNGKILNRYYWHFSKSKSYWEQANKYVSGGGQQDRKSVV